MDYADVDGGIERVGKHEVSPKRRILERRGAALDTERFLVLNKELRLDLCGTARLGDLRLYLRAFEIDLGRLELRLGVYLGDILLHLGGDGRYELRRLLLDLAL